MNRMCVYLHSVSEPGAEGVKDAEAVVQSERVSVLAEEVDQLAAFLLQLLPTEAQRAQRRGGTLWWHRNTDLKLKHDKYFEPWRQRFGKLPAENCPVAAVAPCLSGRSPPASVCE